ncbi:AraC family transcriptional regulator [Pontixanthobacter sp. CEM42]|uniref:AraC family transcriptional regulator n=1 Tax=Pontixanthobacter sp. CEM42 TaxID=2792077 RepID=UPI001ADFD367|nr:AraC family transcriptional regulator [Pontixanthobacter sp. CEM42]
MALGFDLENFDRPVLSTQIARLIVEILGEQGVSPKQAFGGLAFDESDIDGEDAFLSFNQMFSLIDEALRLSLTPWLGLKVGDRETVGTWGVLGYAIMSSANEIEAAKIGSKFFQAAPSLMETTITIDGYRQRIQMDPIFPIARLVPFCVEENVMGILRVASEYLQEPPTPLEVHLSYPKPVYARKYEEYFGCPVRYDQPQNVVWTRAPTDQPLRTSDPASAAICLKLAEQLSARHKGEDNFLRIVRRELLRTPGKMQDMEAVASGLAISSRTLRRKLKELGTSFRLLQDEIRKSLATDYLTHTSMSVDQISARLGYTETTNFRRAFKQWTEVSPSRYRATKSNISSSLP